MLITFYLSILSSSFLKTFWGFTFTAKSFLAHLETLFFHLIQKCYLLCCSHNIHTCISNFYPKLIFWFMTLTIFMPQYFFFPQTIILLYLSNQLFDLKQLCLNSLGSSINPTVKIYLLVSFLEMMLKWILFGGILVCRC